MNGRLIRWAWVAAAFMLAHPVSALSCLRPDVAQMYLDAASSDRVYSVLLGELSFDESLLPRGVRAGEAEGDPGPIAARFSGRFLGQGGFVQATELPIVIEPSCSGPWCGGLPANVEALLFVYQRSGSLILEVPACGDWHFHVPSAQDVARVEACHAGGPCAPVGRR